MEEANGPPGGADGPGHKGRVAQDEGGEVVEGCEGRFVECAILWEREDGEYYCEETGEGREDADPVG